MSLLSETRNVTVQLQEPADIRFISLETEKPSYPAGESVRINFTIGNIGSSRANNPVVKVVDTNSGQTLVTITTKGLDPDEQFSTTTPFRVGDMPDHDWDLTISTYNLG